MDDIDIQRKIVEILRYLSDKKDPVGARIIARELKESGYNIGERAVRYYLKIMDERGLTKKHGQIGRKITEKGIEELEDALIQDRLGFIITKIETIAYNVTYDPIEDKGTVASNISFVEKKYLEETLEIMKNVYDARLSISPHVLVVEEGETLGGYEVPKDMAVIATVCSITFDGVLFKAGIPVEPKFGGVVQFLNHNPYRFSDVISYHGSSLEPLEVFMTKKITSIDEVIETGNGKILANFREIPMIAKEKAEKIFETMEKRGFTGLLKFGKPNQPLLGMPVGRDKIGISLIGGVNSMAAVEEKGFETKTMALESIIDIKDFKRL